MVFAGSHGEPLRFRDQNRGEGRSGELPAIRTVAIGEHEQSSAYLVFNRAAVTTAFDHSPISFGSPM
jgi:hypothetical protein